MTDERVSSYFEHQGHRTAVSQRALQANADPWLGWCTLRGEGQVVQEMSPYQADIDWDGVQEPDEILPLLVDLGLATWPSSGWATGRSLGRITRCSSTPSATAASPVSNGVEAGNVRLWQSSSWPLWSWS